MVKKEKRLKEVTYMFIIGIILFSILSSIAIWVSEYSLSEKFLAQAFSMLATSVFLGGTIEGGNRNE